MKVVTNRHGSYLTGDDIADAVLYYGLTLARDREYDVVDIPYLDHQGAVHRVQFTVGWLIEVSTTSADGADELVDVEVTMDLYSKAAVSRAPRPHPFTIDELAEAEWHRFDVAGPI